MHSQSGLQQILFSCYLDAGVVGDVLQQAVFCDCTIVGSEAPVIRVTRDSVSPFVDHMKAFRVPNMGLQPDFITLPTTVLGEEIAGSPAILSGWSFVL